MDVILTPLGRQQMAKGEFNVQFASFSDRDVEYKSDAEGALESIGDKFFFESFAHSQLEIIPEVNDEGNFQLLQSVNGELKIQDGKLVSITPTGPRHEFNEVEAFTGINAFGDTITNRFKSLTILNTISDVKEFESTKLSEWLYSSFDPPPFVEPMESYEEELERRTKVIPPISVDPIFENQMTTKFLPPFTTIDAEKTPIRSFNDWRNSENIEQTQNELLDSILDDLKSYPVCMKAQIGDSSSTDHKKYDIIGQVFCLKRQSIKKYLIVEAGEFFDEFERPLCKIFYLGFIYKSPSGISKFLREFSVVFHQGDI